MKLLLLFFTAIWTAFSFAAEDMEPPLGYTLLINGIEHRMKSGETIQLKGTFTDPSIKLIADKERLFSYTGLSFRYPAYFSFEADLKSENNKNWILSGNDFKIMIFKVKGALIPDTFAHSVAKKFGKDVKISDVERTFGGKQYKGKRVDVAVAEKSFSQEAFLLVSKGVHIMLVLQDALPSQKVSEEESKGALDLLQRQFEYKD